MGTIHRLRALAAPVAFALQMACTPPAAPPSTAKVTSPPVDPGPVLVTASPDEARTRDRIVAELQDLERLAAASPAGSRQRPAILRRLAEGYVELESAALRDQINHETKAAAASSADAERLAAIVASARRNAIKSYQELATSYPTFCVEPGVQCGDEVLHYLAYEHEQDNQLEEARRAYQELIKSFPGSKFLPNAYLFFGERLFVEAGSDPSKLALAEKAYRKAAEAPPPGNQVWGYAHYKLAYVAWTQGDSAHALAEFQQVIDSGARFPSLPNAGRLVVAARKDILPVYAQIGDPAKAFDFLQPLSGDPAGANARTLAMSYELGEQYMDTGHYKESILLDLDLIRRAPGEPSCAPLARLDRTIPRLGRADAAALRAALDREKKLLQDARSQCTNRDAKDLSGPIHKCAPTDPCNGL